MYTYIKVYECVCLVLGYILRIHATANITSMRKKERRDSLRCVSRIRSRSSCLNWKSLAKLQPDWMCIVYMYLFFHTCEAHSFHSIIRILWYSSVQCVTHDYRSKLPHLVHKRVAAGKMVCNRRIMFGGCKSNIWDTIWMHINK